MACLSDKNRHFRTHMVTITDSMASSFYFLQETALSYLQNLCIPWKQNTCFTIQRKNQCLAVDGSNKRSAFIGMKHN